MKKHILMAVAAHLIATAVFSQKIEVYRTDGGLCNSTVTLFPDGYYNMEYGCEASSHITFGTWVLKNDTVRFTEVNGQYKAISRIVSSKTDKKLLTVKLFDSNGRNITDKFPIGQQVRGGEIYTMDLDNEKMERTDFVRDSGVVFLKTFHCLMGKSVEVAVDSDNVYEIYLNIPEAWIYPRHSNCSNSGDFMLVKTKEGLTSIFADTMEHGEMVNSVYRKAE